MPLFTLLAMLAQPLRARATARYELEPDRDARRTLDAVYVASGVQGACSHRFRHTPATEILEMGGTFEEAADIPGDTEAIIRKHCAKWSAGRQARISELLARIWHAKKPSLEV